MELLKYVNGRCRIPGIDEGISYGDEWKSKASLVLNRAEKACGFESAEDYIRAIVEWKKIFGDRFQY